MKEKAVIYARVSSREQEETGYSLDAQEKLLTEYAENKNLVVVKAFRVSEPASGDKQRKVFSEMLTFVEKRGIKILICEKTDRLTRKRKDAVLIDEWVRADATREVHFVKENFILTRDSRANEKFIWGIKVEVAQYYTSNLSEEVRKGQKEKIAQGWLPTKPPLGYKTIGEKGHKVHVIDENKAPLVKKMFELYATGEYPVERLSHEMYRQGLRTRGGYRLGRSRLAEILSDPFYVSKIRWNSKVYDGKQEALISKDLFDRMQEVKGRKTQAKYRKHDFLFKGIPTCRDCGGVLTWEKQKGIVYGHCNQYRSCQKRTWYKESEFITYVGTELTKLVVYKPRLAEWIRKALKELHKTEIECRDKVLTELQNQQNRLRQRQSILYNDKLDERITAEFYDEKNREITSELEVVLEAFKRQSEADKKYYELGIDIRS